MGSEQVFVHTAIGGVGGGGVGGGGVGGGGVGGGEGGMHSRLDQTGYLLYPQPSSSQS